MTRDNKISRRGFMQAGAVSLSVLSSLAGGAEAQQIKTNANVEEYQAVPYLIGRERPSEDFLEDKPYYAYVFEDLSGNRWFRTQDSDGWQAIQAAITYVTDSADLPDPTNGTHTLQDNTAYVFNGFVTSPYGLELGTSTPLIGRHGSVDGFIHTGGETAITATDAGFFARDLYLHAPGGTLFDLAADPTTEMLVESCSFSDAAGIAPIADLGTIDGYRVPSFKGCNFEDFNSGLTLDGTPDKIFFSGCPFRGVTASGVTILTFASTLDVDIVDMPDNYVKGVQSDTEVIRVETGGSPTDVFQYRGTTHDGSVTPSNILTGEASARAVGYRVTNSYPLADSAVTGELDLSSATTVTGSGSAPTQVTGTTTIQNAERTSSPANGVIQYDGKDDTKTVIHVNASVSGANTEFVVYIGRNGSVIQRSQAFGFMPNSSSPVGIVAIAELKLTTGDEISAFIENTGGNADLTVETMAVTV